MKHSRIIKLTSIIFSYRIDGWAATNILWNLICIVILFVGTYYSSIVMRGAGPEGVAYIILLKSVRQSSSKVIICFTGDATSISHCYLLTNNLIVYSFLFIIGDFKHTFTPILFCMKDPIATLQIKYSWHSVEDFFAATSTPEYKSNKNSNQPMGQN